MIAQQAFITVPQLLEKETRSIIGFTNDQVASKLMAMGILPGNLLRVVRIAPMSGGYYLKVNGQNFALRKSEAASIVVA